MFVIHVTSYGVSPVIEETTVAKTKNGFATFATFEEAKQYLLDRQEARIEQIKEDLYEALLIKNLIMDQEY